MTASTAIRCRGVRVERGGVDVVAGIDLDVIDGEWLGVVGPNGAGKTTLLRAIVGLIDHDGEIVMTDRDGSARRPGPTDVAVVPQSPLLPEAMTVAEYVMLGRTAHLGWLVREGAADRRIVAAALRRLGLGRFADRAVVTLSGGEAQRVVVARALVQEAPVLVLDEPTSALDIGHQMSVLELVDDLRHDVGLTVIAAMHDLTAAARFSDRLVLLDEGRVVAEGAPAAVLDADRLSAVYATPLTVRPIDGELTVLPGRRASHHPRAESA